MQSKGMNACMRGWRRILAHAGLSSHYRSITAALVAALVIAGAIALVRFWPRTSPQASFSIDAPQAAAASSSTQQQSSSGGTQASTQASSTDAQGAPASVVVDVAGCVNNPGVYTLPEGSRAVDAVNAAGGTAEGAATASVNLAHVLVDGEQVYIPSASDSSGGAQASAAQGSAASGSSAASSKLVNINTATAEELDTLPGIGPSTAQKIIAEREANGPFESVEDLQRVAGIGTKKVAQLEGYACV